MIAFIARRTLSMLLTFFIVSIVIFLMMHAIPGGPFDGYQLPLPDNSLLYYNFSTSVNLFNEPFVERLVECLAKSVR